MSKTRVFIYGSCVSRDTFEHLDPEQFQLMEYVARQSALSATTRPVESVAPPTLTSRFQQRMVSGDFQSSLRPLLAQHAAEIDVLLIDLTDERLGVYLLPDGTVVTRSVELIESGAEQSLPQGAQHVAFGTQQHYEYWSGAIRALGDSIRQTAPRAAVALLDIPWAEWSESGQQTPDSFGVGAAQANPVFRSYVEVAVEALGAHVISLDPAEVMSGPHHPWGDAPFHYAEKVYLEIVRRLTGTEGRIVWAPRGEPSDLSSNSYSATGTSPTPSTPRPSSAQPNLFVVGTQKAGTTWLHHQLGKHSEIFMSKTPELNFFSDPNAFDDEKKHHEYFANFGEGAAVSFRGESTARYFWHTDGGHFSPRTANPDVPQRIRDTVGGDVLAVISLRNPVERAVAGYWHSFAAGHFDLSTGIFQLPPERGVLDFGFYERHYAHWARVLGPEHLQVLLYDDIVGNPGRAVSEIVQRLGLDTSSAFQEAISDKTDREPEPNWLDRFKRRKPIRPHEIAALYAIYRPEIQFVESLVGRSLPEWHDVDAMVKRLSHGQG